MSPLSDRYRQQLFVFGRFAATVMRRFQRDRCSRVSSALAFTTVLAIVPLTAVGFAVLSIFPVFEKWMISVQQFVYGNFVPAASDIVSHYLQQFAANAGKLTVLGSLFLFVTAVMLIDTIEQAFNDIWHVRRKRTLVRRVTAYWAVITLGPLLMGLSLSITSYFASLPFFSQRSALSVARQVLLGTAPIIFEWTAFVLLYAIVPNCAVRARHAIVGAAIATALFEIAKLLFRIFVTSTTNYSAVYGAVAALPVFLLWIYLSWVVILIGAEVTAALPQWIRRQAAKQVESGTGTVRTPK